MQLVVQLLTSKCIQTNHSPWQPDDLTISFEHFKTTSSFLSKINGTCYTGTRTRDDTFNILTGTCITMSHFGGNTHIHTTSKEARKYREREMDNNGFNTQATMDTKRKKGTVSTFSHSALCGDKFYKFSHKCLPLRQRTLPPQNHVHGHLYS